MKIIDNTLTIEQKDYDKLIQVFAWHYCKVYRYSQDSKEAKEFKAGFTFETGKKYIKILHNGATKGFILKANGALYKAKNYASPDLSAGIRGNIGLAANSLCITCHGIV